VELAWSGSLSAETADADTGCAEENEGVILRL
jgi:hypothetical protein